MGATANEENDSNRAKKARTGYFIRIGFKLKLWVQILEDT
jgi:hypothetical protein